MNENRNNANTPPASAPSELARLQVIDCLEVGPVEVERRRLVAPYRVHQNGKTDTFELIYSYEEPVFEPGDADAGNLAAMLAAQAALNYGLFCGELRFHGPYDSLDRRFLRTMAENTAREIYVKKFLEPNAFLLPTHEPLPMVRQASYLHARLRFVDRTKTRREPDRWKRWAAMRNRYCILSSGGKESLLSFSIIQEILSHSEFDQGRAQVHPIFVNESGRHWFTALNAYRYFERNVPHTARVWVNSDRLFAWMLRHLPFIRPDFSSLRSDEYPIRLWTVAVFLFGVLPLMRKHGLGRLLIGDEYDTSVRVSHQGIRHYDGLYDQSIYFDRAVSTYFLQKGWAVSQFSVLRPLSEILIETILAKRYPDLQGLQISCHAAGKVDDRVVPCGRCEKCHRIVGMLTAIDVDPQRCGYTAGQVADCLKRIAVQGVHQEAACAQHLLYLLIQKKAVQPVADGRIKARERSEVMRIRLDPDRSPVAAVPRDLRVPLYRIFSQYADGAVERIGRQWKPVDLLVHPALAAPYPYEIGIDPHAKSEADDDIETPGEYHWGLMSWPQIEHYLKRIDLALLPVGAVEQHGPHLPLDTDAFDAGYLARRVAEACNPPRPLVMPLVPYGVSYHHSDFKGTLGIGNESLAGLIYDIGMSAAANGVRKLVIINGHGGNAPALNYAAQKINRDAHIFVCVDSGETSDVDIEALVETPNDVHAGEIETSTSLAVRPHLVRRARAVSEVPRFSSRYLDFSSNRGVSWYAYTDRISESGVMGNPLLASARKGEKIWEIMIAHLVALVEDLKQMTLEEIHNRRL
jgi:creatinine amidohydrolase/Fe(II)-dependent formamide hydrolase-like protein